VGGLGLCFAFHGLIERALETGALRSDLDDVREAQKILITQVEALDARMGEILETVEDDAHRSEELVDEVHMLEALVEQMRRRLDEQGDAPAFPARLGGDPLQSGGLLETYGWAMVCWVALPPLFLAAVSLAATGAFRSKIKDHLGALDPLMADAD